MISICLITDNIYFDHLVIVVVSSGFSILILVLPSYPPQLINILCTGTLR